MFIDNLFATILSHPQGNRFVRYTSQQSLVETIKSGIQRMFGIVAMNDKTEVNYVDEYIGISRTQSSKMVEYTNRFVPYCCDISLEDDLALFRMYGYDASGVCINLLSIDLDDFSINFCLRNVIYAHSNNKIDHLDIIKDINDYLNSTLKVSVDFFLNNCWKSFFIPYEYPFEKEVRLLYVNRDNLSVGWLLSYPSNVLLPYIDFHLQHKSKDLDENGFPLLIDYITLGPKHP